MEEYDSSQGLSSSDLKHGSKIDEFRSSIHNLELQLAKTKEDKAMISNRLEELNEKLEESSKKLQKTEDQLHEKTRKIKELEFKVEQSTRSMPPGNIDLISLHHDLKMRDEEISELKNLLKKKDSIIESLKTQSFLEDQKIKNLSSFVKEKSSKNEELFVKLEENKKNLDSLAFSKRNEGTLMVELEHYKADNSRLVSLLKSTQEFKSFSEYAEASEGIRYLPRTNKTVTKGNDECDDWVPSDA